MSGFLSGQDYLSLPRDPNPWLIKDLIPVSGFVNLYGKPKSGKSFAALGMGLAIANGQSTWLNFPVHQHGPVAILQIDTPRGEWADRLATVRKAGYDLSNVFFADMLMAPYPFNILDTAHFTWLREEMAKLKPVLVFIDTIREAHPGDENDSGVMKNVISSLVAACRPAAIGLLSHARKDSVLSTMGGDDLMNDARGSSYIAGRMDTVIKFSKSSMTYKGRSKGEGSLNIEQHEDTGLVQLNALAAAYVGLYQRITMEMLPELLKPGTKLVTSVNAIAKAVAEHTSYRQVGTITHDVKNFLQAQGYETITKK